ncbi:hypothetical protein AVEN_145288-1 [Araneus ventricosus]|uniref:Uncharacterized protein n=1 Tax=Araneus ventricosus TaxID=182803 RepID=A0A4Y2H3V2_ARAVE|nr:hypothetical protein AVEN_145288-1 [Araneus ventricosus]
MSTFEPATYSQIAKKASLKGFGNLVVRKGKELSQRFTRQGLNISARQYRLSSGYNAARRKVFDDNCQKKQTKNDNNPALITVKIHGYHIFETNDVQIAGRV